MTGATMRTVRFDRYGGRDVLYLAEVEVPIPGRARSRRLGSTPARPRSDPAH